MENHNIISSGAGKAITKHDISKNTDRNYILNEVNAMKKKLTHTSRKVGVEEKGGSDDKQYVKLECDTATYEYLRRNLSNLLSNTFGDKYKENVTKRMEPTVNTNNGNQANIEGQKTFIMDGKNLKATFYHTTCSLGLQSGLNNKIGGKLLTEIARDDISILADRLDKNALNKVNEDLRQKVIKWQNRMDELDNKDPKGKGPRKS